MKSNYQQRYCQKQLIGRGNYGRVYMVYDRQTFAIFVAKKIPLQGMTLDQSNRTMRQIQIHKKLNHPNIIEFKEYFIQEQTLIIIMEYCQYGDLSQYIKSSSQKGQLLEERLIMNLFIQLVSGVQYLHEFKVVHRDIKPHNIFINQDGVLKLADFGISKALQTTQEKALTLVGTPYYLSPQACKNEGYTNKSDIWAIGCVLYELCTLHHAFQGKNVLSLANKITHQPVKRIPSQYPPALFKLIQRLLQKDPHKRPSADQILNEKYVRSYSSDFSQQQNRPRPKVTMKQQQYQNQFMPNVQQQYSNQFLEDQKFHPSKTSKTSPMSTKYDTQATIISPMSSGAQKLRQKCRNRMGQKLFEEIYGLMRSLKNEGHSQIQIETNIKKRYSRNEFEKAMDVAQLIYIEDNS